MVKQIIGALRPSWPALLAIVLLLAACGQQEHDPAPVPTAQSLPIPTFAPMSVTAVPSSPTVESIQAAGAAPAALSTPVQTPAELPAPTPTPAPTLPPESLLATGRQLHRYGDYAGARDSFAEVQANAASPPDLRLEAIYDLSRAYLAEGLYGEALSTLELLDQALTREGGDPNQFGQKEQFLRGEALMGLGRYGDAVAAYWKFLDAYPWMGEVVQQRIGAAYQALNDTESAATAYRRAVDVAGDRFVKSRLLEQLARTYNDGGRYADALAAYDEILAVAESVEYRAQVQNLAAKALIAAGDAPGAIKRWQAATAEAPESNAAYLALVELVNRNVDFDLYQRGYIDLYAGAYEPAINAFQAYLDTVAASDARAGSALHLLGQSYLGAGQYGDALATLDRVIAEYPQCDCFGKAWLHKALTQVGLGDSAGARRTYRTFSRDYAADPLAPEALWQSGLLALGEGNQIEAAVDFLALADRFPASDRAPQALYALGFGAFSKKLPDQASQVLSRLQTDYPDYRWDAAAYWLGRSYAAAGKADEARSAWQALVDRAPDTYYGVLAGYALQDIAMTQAAMLDQADRVAGPAGRLEGDDGSQAFAEQWLRTWITGTAGSLGDLPLAVAEDQNLAKGRLLLDLDQRGDALEVLERTFEHNKDNPRALYPLSLEFARRGAYRLSLLSAMHLMQQSSSKLVEGCPIFIQRLSYPRPFNDLIVREARANGFSPLVYFSLIRQESLFEEGARSSAAAQGLAQIVPDTGRWVAEQLGHPEYTNEIIYRPVINLRFGAYYLAWTRKYLDGNLLSALVGYNAGPGNAATWRERSGSDDTLFVEMLTYSEPRVYVQQVLSNLYHYTRLYKE